MISKKSEPIVVAEHQADSIILVMDNLPPNSAHGLREVASQAGTSLLGMLVWLGKNPVLLSTVITYITEKDWLKAAQAILEAWKVDHPVSGK